MKPKDFVAAYYPFAAETEKKTGLSAVAMLSQAALESGWGEKAPGNMFFGVKDKDKGTTGNGQMITTTEYLKTPNAKFPEIISVKPHGTGGVYKYIVKDWFRKYASPEECFTEHAVFFQTVKRYAAAWSVRADAEAFFDALQAAGYATAVDENGKPNYASTMKKIAVMIRKELATK